MLPIDVLYRAARASPHRIAVATGEMEIAYADLVARVDALAAAMQSIDPSPQSRVGIAAYNTIEHLIALLATLAAGKVWVPLNPRSGRAELDSFVAATEPTMLIADEACLASFTPGGATVILGKGDGDEGLWRLIDEHEGARPERAELSGHDLQAIKFTGGSTGRPKGVMQSLRSWSALIANQIHGFGFASDERHLIAAPLTHGTSCYILPILAQGGCLVLIERATPSAILDAFESSGVTSVFLPPTLIYMLLAEDGVEERSYPALRHLIYSGAPMRTQEIRRARIVFNRALETSFGLTEAPQIITCQRAGDFAFEENLSSVGRPALLNRVEVVAPDGTLLPAGEPGEIVVKGDLVMNGYLGDPRATKSALAGGWLHTGDVGVIDKRGHLYIKDRLKDVVITGGFNVYPADVEAALGRHPAVYECVVFGVEDEKWGERVEAAVQLHAGAAVAANDLIAFVKQSLDSVKAPKRVHILEELPRNPVGKVLRRDARAAVLAAEAGPGAAPRR